MATLVHTGTLFSPAIGLPVSVQTSLIGLCSFKLCFKVCSNQDSDLVYILHLVYWPHSHFQVFFACLFFVAKTRSLVHPTPHTADLAGWAGSPCRWQCACWVSAPLPLCRHSPLWPGRLPAVSALLGAWSCLC